MELRDGGYAWVDVLGVTEKKQKPFDEVKDEVKTLAIAKERAASHRRAGRQARREGRRGRGDVAALATEAGGAKVETTPPFTRTTEPQGMPKDAVARAFTLAKGKAALRADATTSAHRLSR